MPPKKLFSKIEDDELEDGEIVEENEEEDEEENEEEDEEDAEDAIDADDVEDVEDADDVDAIDMEENEEDDDEDVIAEREKEEEFEDNNDDDDQYKKITQNIDKNALLKYHPECVVHNFEEIRVLSNIMLKQKHVSIPLLTKYERARVVGMRTVQLNNGAVPLIDDIPETLIENSIIAEQELMAKKIPFIICRPLPNGDKEYWKLEDLEIL